MKQRLLSPESHSVHLDKLQKRMRRELDLAIVSFFAFGLSALVLAVVLTVYITYGLNFDRIESRLYSAEQRLSVIESMSVSSPEDACCCSRP
jgi:translation elongation factor EF-1beta